MATYALSWERSPAWAAKLRKPLGRAVSEYRSARRDAVELAAQHINELDPTMQCKVEVYL